MGLEPSSAIYIVFKKEDINIKERNARKKPLLGFGEGR